MKKIVIISIFAACCLLPAYDSHAQKYANSVYGEILGHGLWYSVNYERNVYAGEKFFLSPSIGFTTWGRELVGTNLLALAYFGGPLHSFETGLGYMGFHRRDDGGYADPVVYFDHYITARLGYRYESANGFLFKLAFTPFRLVASSYPIELTQMWGGSRSSSVVPSFGMSFGKSF